MELSSPKLKKLLIFQEGTLKPQALKNFLYFFLIFEEFLKINFYILHHNVLHQNYYKKFICL